eukprot:TRINITY_DN14050_c0_g1_i5.p2 TRINITY_DN14050_c0_g1~~TRINITY_DN14050_c0_g1_i5.p2  ORF type:complete len:119 (-),score=24.17 TRINITY_DN14050_c0_g1_i5:192-548(-)
MCGVEISNSNGEQCCGFFFFKQKTAYEMQRGLVGSEMCIRDRYEIVHLDLLLNRGTLPHMWSHQKEAYHILHVAIQASLLVALNLRDQAPTKNIAPSSFFLNSSVSISEKRSSLIPSR